VSFFRVFKKNFKNEKIFKKVLDKQEMKCYDNVMFKFALREKVF